MNSWFKLLTTLGILSFWVIMNTQLVVRQIERNNLGRFPSRVNKVFQNETFQENWMGIYKDNKKVGYTGFSIERVFPKEGVRHHMNMDTFVQVKILNKPFDLTLKGFAITDDKMLPMNLNLVVSSGPLKLNVLGERVMVEGNEKFKINASSGDFINFDKILPLENLVIDNGVTLNIPGGVEGGDNFLVPVVNPLTGENNPAKVTVIEKTMLKIDGHKLDCFKVQIQMNRTNFHSWVTEDGIVLRQEFPPPFNYVLKKQSRREAERGFIK